MKIQRYPCLSRLICLVWISIYIYPLYSTLRNFLSEPFPKYFYASLIYSSELVNQFRQLSQVNGWRGRNILIFL